MGGAGGRPTLLYITRVPPQKPRRPHLSSRSRVTLKLSFPLPEARVHSESVPRRREWVLDSRLEGPGRGKGLDTFYGQVGLTDPSRTEGVRSVPGRGVRRHPPNDQRQFSGGPLHVRRSRTRGPSVRPLPGGVPLESGSTGRLRPVPTRSCPSVHPQRPRPSRGRPGRGTHFTSRTHPCTKGESEEVRRPPGRPRGLPKTGLGTRGLVRGWNVPDLFSDTVPGASPPRVSFGSRVCPLPQSPDPEWVGSESSSES